MTSTVHRVRELVVTYKPITVSLPVGGTGRLSTPRDVAVLASALLADSPVEKVIALHLNAKHALIGVHVVSIGALDVSIVHPREVFKAACLSNAAGLVLVHNHPSGDPTPSPDDHAIVARLRDVGVLLGHTAEGLQADSEITPRNLRECEAEAVALLCCAALDLPGVDHCRGYIQSWWGSGNPIPERSAQRVLKAADQILKAGTGQVQS